jgi:hypothetical protein
MNLHRPAPAGLSHRVLAPGPLRLTRSGSGETGPAPPWRGLLQQEWVVAALLALALTLLFQLGVPFRGAFGARVTGDEPFYLLTTTSLIRDGDLDLHNQYAAEAYREFLDESVPLWSQSVPAPDGRLLSPHNVGLSLLVLPAYLWNGVAGVKAFLGLLGALTVACAYVLARRTTGRPRASLAAALLVGVSAPTLVYATQVYPEMPAALCVVILVLLSLRPGGAVARGVWAALLLSALMWLGVKYGPLAACLGLLALTRLTAAGRIALVAIAVPLSIHYAAFHWQTYGDFTPYAVNLVYAGSDTPELLARHAELGNRIYRLLGLWVDREFGLVRWSPILALALPGAWLASRLPQGYGRAILSPVAVQLLVATFLSVTMRGWWFPGRMLVVVLPLLVPPVALGAARLARGTWSEALLLGLSLGTLSATLGLWLGATRGQVTVAVNPFEAGGWWLDGTRALFPLYTAYTGETLALSALCLVAGASLVWATLHPLRGPRRPG